MRVVHGLGIVVSLLVGASGSASAQEYLPGGSATASSGLEAGAQVPARLARARLRLGVDLREDEAPNDVLEIGLLSELTPTASVGADARYGRRVGQHFLFDAGVSTILLPASLYGACAAATYSLSVFKGFQVVVGPEADFYFLGTDLPSGVVLWQLRLQGGIHVDF